jgi:hypothetical protein
MANSQLLKAQGLKLQQLKSGTLHLYEEDDAYKIIPANRQDASNLLSYVIEKNLDRKLPTRKEVMNLFGSEPSFDRARKYLLSNDLMLSPSVMRIFFEYHHYERGRMIIEESVKEALDAKVVDEQRGSYHGGHGQWTKKFKACDASAWQRCYIALITREGIPVFNSIFPHLPYTALATLKDAPLLIKYFLI